MSKKKSLLEVLNEPAELDDEAAICAVLDSLKAQYPDLLNPETEEAFIKGMDYGAFRHYLVTMNGSLRSIDAETRTFDARNMVLEGPFGHFQTPDEKDKDKLLEEIFTQAQRLDDPIERGVVIGLGINLVHAFADGNGRLSRLSYLLFSGKGDETSIREALSHTGRSKFDISPLWLNRYILEHMEKEPGFEYLGKPQIENWQIIYDTHFQPDVKPETQDAFRLMIQTSHENLARYALAYYLLGKGWVSEPYIVDRVVKDRVYHQELDQIVETPRNQTYILLAIILDKLPEQELREVLAIYGEEKNRFVRTMIRAITNPDDYPLDDETGWDNYSNLKEYLLHQLRRKI